MNNDILITDIHTHVAPGIDDGPRTPKAAIELLNAHREAGTARLFCTSHFMSPHFDVDERQFHAAYEKIVEMRGTLPDLTFEEGAEVRVTPTLDTLLLEDRVPTLGATAYVLLEFPNGELDDRALQLAHEFRVRSMHPVMAHPERNIQVQKRIEWIDELKKAGWLLQLTAQCLESAPASRSHMADRTAWAILERGAATVIASDAHDTAFRPPGLRVAYETVATRFGSRVSETLIANANAIWNNEPTETVVVEQRRSRFPFSRRR